MIRAALVLLAAIAASSAAAQDGGPIRTGEHSGFTRIVMMIEPTTEWSLETSPGAASIFFPGRRVEFGVEGVFDRIPRTRVTAIKSTITPHGTRIDVAVNCDCRITASFVGARHLALDVGDRTATHATDAAPAPASPEAAPGDASAQASPAPDAEQAPDPAAQDPATQAAETQGQLDEAAVVSAESVLLQQLSRAADQGIIQLAPDETLPEPEPAPAPEPEPAPSTEAAPETEMIEGEPVPGALAELMLQEQIEAITVFDRDNASLAAQRAAEGRKAPSPCVPDDALDVGRWSNGLALHAQTPQLMRGVVGEFDKPDAQALRDLARLYVRFGFGAEAESLLEDFGAQFPDRPLLTDLARAVEGRPVDPQGPLALDLACPDRHGLWLALGGAAPAWNDREHFTTVQAAFADLPPDLRASVGPTLISRLVDAERPAEARLIEVTLTRAGGTRTVELQLAAARLLAAEGLTNEALASLNTLAESNAYNAVDALIEMTRIAIDANLVVPERMLVDLRGAALQQRGDLREGALRGLLVEALAQRGALADAIAELRAAQADIPAARGRFAQAALAILGAAEPDLVGAGAYAQTILDSSDLIPLDAAGDTTRVAISRRMIDVGLPNAALGMLAPPLARGDVTSRLIAARAHIALGDAPSALAVLEGAQGAEALTLRAAAFSHSGQLDAAVTLLDEAGADAEAQGYAWQSGDWDRVSSGDANPERVAMARFMAAQTGDAPTADVVSEAPLVNGDPGASPDGDSEAAEPATLTPASAFDSPLPPLDEPSLASARSMLATAAEVGGFLNGLLSADTAAATP